MIDMTCLASGASNVATETRQSQSQPQSPSSEQLPFRPTTPKKGLKKDGNYLPYLMLFPYSCISFV